MIRNKSGHPTNFVDSPNIYPLLWGEDSKVDSYFSNGLKPKTTTWWLTNIFYFSPLPGEMMQFDYCNIFQMGWNQKLPSRKLTYHPKNGIFESMIFLFPRWDMWIPSKVVLFFNLIFVWSDGTWFHHRTSTSSPSGRWIRNRSRCGRNGGHGRGKQPMGQWSFLVPLIGGRGYIITQ